jgi:tetratricopeptide (TPR) repeat protein
VAVFKTNILYLTIGLLAGLMVGFLSANMVGRARLEQAQMASGTGSRPEGQSASGKGAAPANGAQKKPPVTEEQIREAIAKADSKPDDIDLQKNFGRALYHYANQTQDPRYLEDVVRFLKRVYDANPKDREITVELANALFDIGQTSVPEGFSKARVYYLKALEMKPDDASVHTDLGLTYYLGQPSDPQRAIAEYRKSLQLAPRDERALQSLATALISTGNREEAQRRIEELRSVNPDNPSLSNLRAQLAQSKNATAQE